MSVSQETHNNINDNIINNSINNSISDFVPSQETCLLPSNGAWYSTKEVTLRMKTTLEVKKGYASTGPRTEPDIIQKCIVSPDNVNIYNMSVFDAVYLMYRLRILTWGSMLPQVFVCPFCGKIYEEDLDLDSLEIRKVPEGFTLQPLELPLTKSILVFRFLTLEDFIQCQIEGKQKQQEYPEAEENFESSMIVEKHIESVDGKKLNGIELTSFLNKLPAKDYALIEAYTDKIDTMFGVKESIEVECGSCQNRFTHLVQLTKQFFRPTV